jgi:hypothetical protein
MSHVHNNSGTILQVRYLKSLSTTDNCTKLPTQNLKNIGTPLLP